MSLRDEIDTQFIANTIIFDTDAGYYVLVEGDTDDNFYSKFLNLDVCQIEVCNGKERVIEVLNIINSQKKKDDRTIAIVDKDFDFLLTNSYPANLFVTDFHDVEMMCVHSDAFSHFEKEFFSKKKLQEFYIEQNIVSLRNYLLNITKPVCEMRILSIKEKLNLAFKQSPEKTKELDYKKFICKDKLQFKGYKDLIDAIRTYYNQAVHLISSDIEEKLKLLDLNSYSLFDICHGHDFSQVLVIAIQKRLGKSTIKTITVDEVERALRLSYSFEDFNKTELKKAITQYNSSLLKSKSE